MMSNFEIFRLFVGFFLGAFCILVGIVGTKYPQAVKIDRVMNMLVTVGIFLLVVAFSSR